jgi:plastocyanin
VNDRAYSDEFDISQLNGCLIMPRFRSPIRGSLIIAIAAFLLLAQSTIIAGFATTSTSLSSVPSTESPDRSSLFKELGEFLAPTGYEQAREDPSYAVTIPFTDLGASQFEPQVISIPANMTVIWFNEDQSPHSVTVNAGNSTVPASEQFDSDLIDPDSGSFIHKFTVPGVYDYYDSTNPSSKGRVNVGGEYESGQNMDMLVGGNALPFEAGKIGRTTFSFVPKSNVTAIPPSVSITYNVTILNSTDTLYSNQFEDSDGILDLELIPSARSSSSSSNQTAPHFVTWGPDLTDQEGVASDGTYHVQGPMMVDNDDYTISISIVEIDNTAQSLPPSDDFLLPSTNSSNTLIPFAPGE